MIRHLYFSNLEYKPTLILTLGFMETGDIWEIGSSFSYKGISVFMFDFRVCFSSEGKQSLNNSQKDLGVALSFIKSTEIIRKYVVYTSKIILERYSYGGRMSMLYATFHPSIKRVVSISGGDHGIIADQMRSDPNFRKNISLFFNSLRKPVVPVEFQYSDPISALLNISDHLFDKHDTTDILLIGGHDNKPVRLEKHMVPLCGALKENINQKIIFSIYQTGHSYEKVSDKLLLDIISWINK